MVFGFVFDFFGGGNEGRDLKSAKGLGQQQGERNAHVTSALKSGF